MSNTQTAATTEAGEHSVRLSRVYRATPQFLFDCFTNPALVMQWWGPEGASCPRAECNLTVGGRYEYDMVGDDSGRSFNVKGTFLVIEPPTRLVFSWVWDDTPAEETRVELIFRAVTDDQTELTLVHDRFPNASRAQGHNEGWTSSLEALARMVETHAG